MSALELLERCRRHLVAVSLDGEDRLRAVPLFPETHPMPGSLVAELREHKPEVLALLEHQERADALLMASTGRLGSVWPPGCPLEGPRWDAQERAVDAAYWSEDLEKLRATLADRESYAREVFNAYRNEVTS